ncbi:glycosyltransferase family 39 protein [Candidatus Omnitrophota bacterium]
MANPDNVFYSKLLNRGLIFLAVFFSAVSLVYVFFGPSWPDEGHYFNNILLIAKGEIPYLDFWLYQGPVFCYAYSLLQSLFGPSMYLARLNSLFFVSLILVLVYLISKRLASKTAGTIAVALIALNPLSLRFFTSISTYALTAFLILLSLYLLIDSDHRFYKKILSASLMVLAVGVRTTVFPAPVLLLIYLLVKEKNNRLRAGIILAASLITALLIWGPFLIIARDQTIFGNIGWYFQSQEFILDSVYQLNFWAMVQNKIFIIFELLRNYLAIWSILSVFLISRLLQKNIRPWRNSLLYCFASITLMLILVHFILPRKSYTIYILYCLPLLAVLTAVAFSRMFSELQNLKSRRYFMILILVLILFTALIQVKGPLPSLFSPQSADLAYINRVASYLKTVTRENDEIFSFYQHFVAQADRSLPSGLELSIYAYVPGWDEERCKKYRLYNTKMIMDYISSRKARALILTDKDYRRFAPEADLGHARDFWLRLKEEIGKNYYLTKEITRAKGRITKTYVYLPKDPRYR